MATMRGMCLATVWCPVGLGFAIVTTSIPGLSVTNFLGVSFLSAMLLLLCSIPIFGRADGAEKEAVVMQYEDASLSDLVLIVSASALLLLTCVGIHLQTGLSFVQSAVIIFPIVSILWIAIEREEEKKSDLILHIREFWQGSTDMRVETGILLFANVFGACLSVFVFHYLLSGVGYFSHALEFWFIIATIILIPISAILFIPHTIVVVLSAQVLGATTVGRDHPVSLALALTLGWALAIGISPISATTLSVGRQLGVPSTRVGNILNRHFTIYASFFSIIIICFLYQWGC